MDIWVVVHIYTIFYLVGFQGYHSIPKWYPIIFSPAMLESLFRSPLLQNLKASAVCFYCAVLLYMFCICFLSWKRFKVLVLVLIHIFSKVYGSLHVLFYECLFNTSYLFNLLYLLCWLTSFFTYILFIYKLFFIF